MDFWTLLQHDEVADTSEERLNIIENQNPTITIEESYEPSSLASGKSEIKNLEEKCKLLQGICCEGEREVSHKHKEKYVLSMEYITEILTDEDCA